MTWTGQFTVESVSNEEAPGRQVVTLVATAGEKVKPFKQSAHPDYAETEVDALQSNTEGKLVSAKLVLVFEEDEPPLDEGDFVSVTGHFTKKG